MYLLLCSLTIFGSTGIYELIKPVSGEPMKMLEM